MVNLRLKIIRNLERHLEAIEKVIPRKFFDKTIRLFIVITFKNLSFQTVLKLVQSIEFLSHEK